jgi:FkbM family methyltransferase
VLGWFGQGGLERNINGTDPLRVTPELYHVPEVYEPSVWAAIMRELQSGDIVADVGAYIGLYTVAAAKRVGTDGRVYAFEPDPDTVRLLRRQVGLNGIAPRTRVLPYAVGDSDGEIAFVSGRDSESHVSTSASGHQLRLPSVTLDAVFSEIGVDVLKIDVEGFEERVLRGARCLLKDRERAPRAIFIEVHPFAWKQFGTSSNSLIGLLASYDYAIFDLRGNRIEEITEYGEVVARRTLQ